MALKATTNHPEEVRKHFLEYADILDIYANDQVAMAARFSGGKRERAIRAQLYAEIAAEIRSIKFEKGE